MKQAGKLFRSSGEQGAITPIAALGLTALVAFLALSIDMGQLFVVRNELQNVADAAALAAAKQLIRPNANMDAVVDCSGARTAAQQVASQNTSIGGTDPLIVNDGDVILGKWNSATRLFNPSGCDANPMNVNAVQVTVQRNGGAGNNSKVTFYFAKLFGATEATASATATAYLDLTGTSSIDLPFAVSSNYPGGGSPTARNTIRRFLDGMGPPPAYALSSQTYTWHDYGGNPPPTLDTTRATFAVPSSGQVTMSDLESYIKGPSGGGARFPQLTLGQRIYPASEYNWGSNVKTLFTRLQTRYNASKNAAGKWRVTVPVFSTSQVTSSLPQDSLRVLAARFLPGVSQAHACQSYSSPVVYVQGFMDIDISGVNSDNKCATCNTGTNQITDTNSCRNVCYMVIQVPLATSTVTTDKGGKMSDTKQPRSYQTMNPSGNNVGVFSALPRIVK